MAEMLGILGPPKTGKSHFARSCAELGKTAVALMDPTEENFYKAAGIDTISTFMDLGWRPHKNEFKADAFNHLMNWIDARYKDDSEFVVIDPASTVSDLIMHEALKMHNSDNPKSAGGYGEAYTAHNRMMTNFLQELQRLYMKNKWVTCTWHTRMKEMEGAGEVKKGKDMSGKEELQFEERLLPVLQSSMRQDVAGWFSGWLHTKLYGFGPGTQYCLTALPDQARPAGTRLTFSEKTNLTRLPNTMAGLMGELKVIKVLKGE